MKYIFITPSIYPRMSANTKCALKISKELIKNNHNVVFISVSNTKMTINHDGIFCYLVPIQRSIIYKFLEFFNVKSSSIFRKYLQYIPKIMLRLKKSFRGCSFDLSLVHRIKGEIERRYSKGDVLIPICFPIEACMAANQFKKENSEVRVFPYLLDLFSDSYTAHMSQSAKESNYFVNLEIEREILSSSEICFCLGTWDSWINKVHLELKHKSIVLNLPLIDEYLYVSNKQFSKNFLICGMLSLIARNPASALSVFEHFLRKLTTYTLEIYHSGDCERIIRELSSANVIDHGLVSEKIATEAIKSAKYLVVVGNNDIRQVQSKVFEFISTGKPIIYFYKSVYDPIYSSLLNYDNVCFLDESLEIECLVRTLNDFVRKPYRLLSKNEILSKFYAYAPSVVSEEFRKHINGT